MHITPRDHAQTGIQQNAQQAKTKLQLGIKMLLGDLEIGPLELC